MYPNLKQEHHEEAPAIPMQSLDCSSPEECHTWLQLFRRFDVDNDGFIPTSELKRAVRNAGATFALSPSEAALLVRNSDRNGDRLIDFAEFCTLMSTAKHLHMRHVLFRAAQFVVPKSEREQPFDYLSQYNCLPPPLFLLIITIVQIAVYIYYVVKTNSGISISKPVPTTSPLIFDPYKREQIWRYITYMLIHIGIYHLVFNVIAQLIIGLPLEIVHKWWRVAIVYLIGVISGSLLVSLTDPNVFLAGASGGVYALLAAHIANLLVNWNEMEFALIRAIAIGILVVSDFGVAIYNRYYSGSGEKSAEKVSYVSHIGGFVAGILMGIVVLRNFRSKPWERVVWWIALVGYICLFLACIIITIVQVINS